RVEVVRGRDGVIDLGDYGGRGHDRDVRWAGDLRRQRVRDHAHPECAAALAVATIDRPAEHGGGPRREGAARRRIADHRYGSAVISGGDGVVDDHGVAVAGKSANVLRALDLRRFGIDPNRHRELATRSVLAVVDGLALDDVRGGREETA